MATTLTLFALGVVALSLLASGQEVPPNASGQEVPPNARPPPLSPEASQFTLVQAIYAQTSPRPPPLPADTSGWVWDVEKAQPLPDRREENKLRKEVQKEMYTKNKEISKFYHHRVADSKAAQNDLDQSTVALRGEMKKRQPLVTYNHPYPLYKDQIVQAMLERDPNIPLPAHPPHTPAVAVPKKIPHSKKTQKNQKFVNHVAKYSQYVFEYPVDAPSQLDDSCQWKYTDDGGIVCATKGERNPGRKSQRKILIDPTMDVAVDMASHGFAELEDALLEYTEDCVDFYKDKRSGVILCVPTGAKAKDYRKQDRYQHGGVVLKKKSSANKTYWKEYTTRLKDPIPPQHIATAFVNTVDLGPSQQYKYSMSKKQPIKAEWQYANERIPMINELIAPDTR
eukprot:GHVN01032746.1.p1 GENE.GHVN01032746.1~~GHVN01032746.1.p1  ORF type:complete len:396 (-),score=57.84 GHVN01032746.1:1466-2653(-)